MFGSLGSKEGRRRYYGGAGLSVSQRGVISVELADLDPGDLFLSLDDATSAENAIKLDGSTILGGAVDNPQVAARYSWMVVGSNLVLPDARGRALRFWDHGRGRDPDAASRGARAGDGQTGDFPGTPQGHQFHAHTHTVHAYGDVDNATVGAWDAAYWATGTLTSVGGNETRGININGALWMKLDD